MANETAIKLYGINDLIKGVKINNVSIVGMIDDYNISSLYETIGSLVIFRDTNAFAGDKIFISGVR